MRPFDAGRPDPTTAWMPPFVVDDSDTGLCAEFPGEAAAVDLWARGGRVYVATDVRNPGGGWPSGSALQVRHGDGWELWYRREHAPDVRGESKVSGATGPGVWSWGGECWLRRIEGPHDTSCVIDAPPLRTGELVEVHMLSDQRAWLLVSDYSGPWPGVMRVDGDDFDAQTPLTETVGDATPLALWGDAVGWFALVRDDLYASGGPAVGRRTDVPEGPYASMWTNRRDDHWIGTASGLLYHYDGLRWRVRASVGQPIRHLWSSSEDRLFFGSSRLFGSWTPHGGVQELLAWTDSTVSLESMYGDDSAVYLLFVDREHATEECGNVFVVAYDGERFRRM